MFRSHTNELKNNNLRDKLYSSEIIYILTSEDMENMPLESRMKFGMNFTSGVFSRKHSCLNQTTYHQEVTDQV